MTPLFSRQRTSQQQTLIEEMITENPILDEGVRNRRRFLRSGRVGVMIATICIALFYLWMCYECFAWKEDATELFAYVALTVNTFVIPFSIYNCISGERERATWDALILTRLTVAQIIVGKLVWRFRIIAYILIACILPAILSRLASVVQDIALSQMIAAEIVIIAWCLLICSFGLWVSSFTRKSITSLNVIAGVLIGVLVVLPMLLTMFNPSTFSSNEGDWVTDSILTINPFTMLNVILNPTSQYGVLNRLDSSGFTEVFLYFLLTIAFLYGSYGNLRRLETPAIG